MSKKQCFLRVSREEHMSVFTLGNGFSLRVDVLDYPQNIREEFMRVGMEDALRDSTSNDSKTMDYVAAQANLESKHEAFLRGEWTRRSGTGLGYLLEDIISAAAAYKGLTYAEAEKKIRAADKDKLKAAIKADKQFAAEIADAAAVRLQRAAEGAAAPSNAVDELFA